MEGYPSSTWCGRFHTTLLDKRARELPGIESRPRRERISRLFAHRNPACGDQPLERAVEPIPDQPLQPLVAVRALAPELVPLAVAPDDAGREQHRTARPRPFLADGCGDAELAEAGGGDEAGHPGPRHDDGHVNENVGLCSTYSIRT